MNAPDSPIYLDDSGVTPVAPEVLDATLPLLQIANGMREQLASAGQVLF